MRLPIVNSSSQDDAASAERAAVREALPRRPSWFGKNGVPPLADAQGRKYTYLRFSVTDRCDMACRYCMPLGGELDHGLRKDLLSFEESARLVSAFADAGIRRVRFTGGEPLVRKDFVRLVELIKDRSAVEQLVVTTNASRLEKLAEPLWNAGISGVNVSIDTLDPKRFADVTRGGDLEQVLAGIDAALALGFEVKTNTVAMRGVNDDELIGLVEWAWSRGITPRFIELMPLGEAAQLPRDMLMPADEIVQLLGDRIGATAVSTPASRGPAFYRASAANPGNTVGFITALTHNFCDACNRVRVTAQGDIRACLASRRAISLRDQLRAGASQLELQWAMHWALSGKDEGHRFTDQAEEEHTHVGMSLIGG